MHLRRLWLVGPFSPLQLMLVQWPHLGFGHFIGLEMGGLRLGELGLVFGGEEVLRETSAVSGTRGAIGCAAGSEGRAGVGRATADPAQKGHCVPSSNLPLPAHASHGLGFEGVGTGTAAG